MADALFLQKVEQTHAILRELEIDAWLIFVRESETLHDPSLDVVVGANVTWHSAFLFTASGRRTAIVGSLDVARIERTGVFHEVIGYVGGIGDDLRRVLTEVDPATLALNYSQSSELADGLTYGMYQVLGQLLEGTPFFERAVSAERLIGALRGRKSTEEVSRVAEACRVTQEIFASITPKLRVGLTEKEVAALIVAERQRRGLAPAWEEEHCPAVFTGPDSAGAHAGPTDARIEPGHVMNVDFGLRWKDYCSDLQRTWYFSPAGETAVPEAVGRGFDTIRDAIQAAAKALVPGAKGHEVDAVARRFITDRGYEEYDHGLGHQVGRTAHDGSGLLAPAWERYGARAHEAVEAGQIYTLEPRLTIAGHGIATLEEIVVVTEDGCRFLSDPQTELWVVSPD